MSLKRVGHRFHKKILFSGEAYGLNEYVNKQNGHIWIHENPQVIVVCVVMLSQQMEELTFRTKALPNGLRIFIKNTFFIIFRYWPSQDSGPDLSYDGTQG